MGEMPFSVTQGAVDRFTGDLVSFVTDDRLAPLVGLSPEITAPYTAESQEEAGLDIFAGAGSGATLLIGTSYSANPAWSFAEALKLALRKDVLNFAVEGQGPAQPMLDFLASSEFTEAPPAVVIWEFPVRYLTDPSIWGDNGPVKSGA
jgi:alginate O-acetyltransferase complex protein AlgJ